MDKLAINWQNFVQFQLQLKFAYRIRLFVSFKTKSKNYKM